ncbi:hypothetical protein TMatcc_002009 [Talaromyces marneffei ATCC 18224]|uniref:uncharacterized protein n=1 Tax=Talaromyces marneffei TaxID=37727 RepID=UPI0012A77E37|nr:uncharacterized protein EYB26_006809 [Talaromyces marneffei]KAE8552005.1 hypothetical protein EYB25_005896 [Talaromyces marneffei]QGA19121.1 hypothetical protein EYB26_006809 [Talaromyces marneffei]
MNIADLGIIMFYEDANKRLIAIEDYNMVHTALTQMSYEKRKEEMTEKVFCFVSPREGLPQRHGMHFTHSSPPLIEVRRHICSRISSTAVYLKAQKPVSRFLRPLLPIRKMLPGKKYPQRSQEYRRVGCEGPRLAGNISTVLQESVDISLSGGP